MRYQLPDGMSSISAEGHSFVADDEGVITVPADAPANVHALLQSKGTWGLTALEDIPGTEITGSLEVQLAAVSALPTEAPVSMRDHKKNLLVLLRGFGHVLDGRCTFEFLRRKVMTVLHEMDPESLASAKASATDPATGDASPSGAETPPATPPAGDAEPPTDPTQGAEDPAPTQETPKDGAAKDATADEPADPLTAPIPPTDPAATPPTEPPATPGA